MHQNKLTKHIIRLCSEKQVTTMTYEEIFKGSAIAHAITLGRLSSPLEHRLGKQDPETYFKEVFAGEIL